MSFRIPSLTKAWLNEIDWNWFSILSIACPLTTFLSCRSSEVHHQAQGDAQLFPVFPGQYQLQVFQCGFCFQCWCPLAAYAASWSPKHPRTINPRTFQEPVLCCSLLLTSNIPWRTNAQGLECKQGPGEDLAGIIFQSFNGTLVGLILLNFILNPHSNLVRASPCFQKFSKRIRLPRKSHRGNLYTFWGCLPLWLPTMWSDLCESGFSCLGNLLFFWRVPTWSDLCELFEQHDVFDEESFKLFFLNRFSNIWYLNGCTESFEGSHLLWAVVQHMASSWFFERSVRAIVEKERALWFSSSSSVG